MDQGDIYIGVRDGIITALNTLARDEGLPDELLRDLVAHSRFNVLRAQGQVRGCKPGETLKQVIAREAYDDADAFVAERKRRREGDG